MSSYYEFALECKLKRNVPPKVIDTLKYMTRSQEYDFDPPKLNHALFKETSAWKQTREMFGRKVTVIMYEWRTILTNHPREGEQYLPGKFSSTFQDNQLSCRRLSSDGVFDNVWWLLFPWLASISESTGFVGYYRGNFDDYPKPIQFLDGKASVYELIAAKFPQAETIKQNEREITLNLDINALSAPVKQKLIRQAENRKMSLEAYVLSVVAKRYVDEDVLLDLGKLSLT